MARTRNPRLVRPKLATPSHQAVIPQHTEAYMLVGNTNVPAAVGPVGRGFDDAVVAAADFLQRIGAAAGGGHVCERGEVGGVGGETVEGV